MLEWESGTMSSLRGKRTGKVGFKFKSNMAAVRLVRPPTPLAPIPQIEHCRGGKNITCLSPKALSIYFRQAITFSKDPVLADRMSHGVPFR
jgi:hypothetical protein